uniref:Golgin subfamily A member 7/ERF4 domain-containing protein n=1 Tax=Phytophthora ramorum TaxID=164328 RepID=H3GGA6_PHYRM
MAKDGEYEMALRVERIEQQIPAEWKEFAGKPMQMTYYATKVNTFRENPDLSRPSDSFAAWATKELRREMGDTSSSASPTKFVLDAIATPGPRKQAKGIHQPVALRAMVATSFHDPSSVASVVMVRGAGRADGEKEYGEVRLYPTRMRFVTGVARTYEDDFPSELSHLVKETDFDIAINQINNTMQDYWPCLFCICCGYGCCPCTFGLSLLCPNFCIRDAEQYVRALLSRINKRLCFERAGIEWQLVRSCDCDLLG